MKSVLIVDDEEALVLSIELVLANEFKVLRASNGEEALLHVRKEKPDLILMDIMMAGMGGLEALKMLKSHPDFRKIPVIVMSGARPLGRGDEYTWEEFISKPFSVDQLLAVIRKFI